MNLDTAFHQLATYLNLDAAKLISFAAEDEIGGFHPDPSQRQWPMGSMFAVEGRILYALTRALKPMGIVELGAHVGCSSTHFAAALKANGKGTLYSVDFWEGAGGLIPDDLRPFIQQTFTDALAYVEKLPKGVSIVFEDLLHTTAEVEHVWSAAARQLKPGSLIISHDAAHPVEGHKIRRGIENAGMRDYLLLLVEPSDCGLAIAQVRDK